jgi:hypothetical protein
VSLAGGDIPHPNSATFSAPMVLLTDSKRKVCFTHKITNNNPSQGIKINVNAWNPGATFGTALGKDWPYIAQFITSILSWLPFVRHASAAGKELAEVAIGPSFADANEKYIDRLEIKKSATISYDIALQNDLWTTSVELAKLTEKESPLTK